MSERVCIVCLSPFLLAPKSRRRTCGRSCQSALAWTTNPEKRLAGIAESKRRPDQLAITAATNARRWADPQEHANLSIDNQERWANKTTARLRARSIKAAWTPEKRAEASDRKIAFWADKSQRERREMIAPAIKASVASPNRNKNRRGKRWAAAKRAAQSAGARAAWARRKSNDDR